MSKVFTNIILAFIAACLGWICYCDYFPSRKPQEVVIVGVSIPQYGYVPQTYDPFAPKKALPVDIEE